MKLETVTGRLIDLTNPDPTTIDIEDIAWGLSRIPRFAGHTITIQPYTVAQHSVFVADEVKSMELDGYIGSQRIELELKALLHDAAEAYMGDWPSPVKQIPEIRPIIKGIEARVMGAICESLGVSPFTEEDEATIKVADRIAQKIEAHAFMPSRGRDWPGMPDVSLERLQQFAAPLPSLEAYKAFKERFFFLIGCIR